MTSEGSSYSPTEPSYAPPPPHRYSTATSPTYSPTSPTYSLAYTSWDPAPPPNLPDPWTDDPFLPSLSWSEQSASHDQPISDQWRFLWEIDDGYPRLPHEWATAEELIRVDNLVTTSSLVDGTTSQRVEVISNANNGDNTNGASIELNEVRIDGCSCPVCYEACTSEGNHRICCLPCGHVYGLSCINKWLRFGRSSNKCPQCKRSCTVRDVKMLYMTHPHTDDRETLLQDINSLLLSLKQRVSSLVQLDDPKEKLPSGLEETQESVHALEESIHALEASLQRVSIGPVR